ncbi:MAG TPA: DoxX family protein [Arenimonas sp.]|jgi:putative oxidoreductase|nr:DoxX family protein [Arenimonas sp.]
MNNLAILLGRVGLSLIFILSGWAKIGGYAGTQQYMEAMGVPGALLPLVILLELGGGLAILAGLFTRWISLAFVLFSLASAFIFHASPDDQINLLKNIAMAGGFLVLAAQGAGGFSLDALIGRRREAGKDA